VRSRLYAVALLILAIGLGFGGAVYFTAADEEQNPAIEEMLTSKRYNRDIERFGGKAAVAFNDFMQWFAARWHGRALGATVAWLSVVASGGVYLVARRSRD
jgi:hypothetical protein